MGDNAESTIDGEPVLRLLQYCRQAERLLLLWGSKIVSPSGKIVAEARMGEEDFSRRFAESR